MIEFVCRVFHTQPECQITTTHTRRCWPRIYTGKPTNMQSNGIYVPLSPSLPLSLSLSLALSRCVSLYLSISPSFFQPLLLGSSQWEQSSVPSAAAEEDSEELSISDRPSFIHKNKWTPARRLDETESLFSSNPVVSPLLLEGAFEYRGVALHCGDE